MRMVADLPPRTIPRFKLDLTLVEGRADAATAMAGWGPPTLSLSLPQCPLSGVKRTYLTASLMSAFDPKRTFSPISVADPEATFNLQRAT